jgi:hypothetical protein
LHGSNARSGPAASAGPRSCVSRAMTRRRLLSNSCAARAVCSAT